MPKKKYLQHIGVISPASSTEEKPAKSSRSNKSDVLDLDDDWDDDDEPVIRRLQLTPAGYPIRPFDAPESLHVQVADPKLFQAYATEQWMGLLVSEGDYIFDQLIIPDYAFKVTKIVPKKARRIGASTQFILEQHIPTKPTFTAITFEEIIGNTQAKEKARVIIEYLKDPKRFGKWAPKNILFHGPPGTGKTLTAKAIAHNANCNFYSKKGTSLIGLHVGDGAGKIHQLYAEAKANAPAIIFIDELDSIGLNRSYQSVRGDVIEVSTALLAEMDGLDENLGIITIGATNGMELLDPGLRSRFEEEILFPLPTESERLQMLRLFAKDAPIPFHVDFGPIAARTDKWSGRDLHEKLMKVAVHKAIQQKIPEITVDLLFQIIETVEKQRQTSVAPREFFV
jgi:AAA family ATPase